jgi:PAS domain S-box-containing protein
MKHLQDLPIQRKVLVMTLAICGAVLLVSLGLLILFQILNFRASFQRDTATLSAIIANNSTAALAFDDSKAAGEILDSLKAKPTVLCASLVNSAGVTVAHYGPEGGPDELKEFPAEHQFSYLGGHLLYTEPVQLQGKHIGRLYLSVNYRSVLKELLRFYALVMAGVLLVSVLLATNLTGRMQKLIAHPVLHLAETSRQVGQRNDYSVRSPLDGRGDELGVLARAFNHMLSRIQSQDVALNLSQQKLESLVNSIDGIVWEWNPHDCKFAYVSRQSERILGHPPEKWLDDAKFWDSMVHPDDLARATAARLEAAQPRQSYNCEYRMIAADGRTVWIRESGLLLADNGKLAACRGILQDITEEKNAAAHLNRLNRQLVDASRQAGMAEVATGVLHNVGNVLNSVNVSASLLRDNVGKSQIQNVVKATNLLREHAGDTAAFLTSDPRGRRLPGYLIKLGDHLAAEQLAWQTELDSLGRNIEHIKEIVAMQQSYARLSGVTEDLKAEDLVEDALRLNEAALGRHDIKVLRQFQRVELVRVDKHKALQILINLIRNAKYAMDALGKSGRILTVSIFQLQAGRVAIQVRDNGIGIPPENLTLIFQHGFTTKKDGHGFGLHSGVNAAREMGGNLAVQSEGPGQGAVFTLELPAATPVNGPRPAASQPPPSSSHPET